CRITSIAIQPSNPNIVYLGTAQGGVYRTLDGGASWVPLMDSALSLAIGAVTIDPNDPTRVLVGTGEANSSIDSFFGVGLYIITNPDTNRVLNGPFNLDQSQQDVLTGYSISKTLVRQGYSNTVFVATASPVRGLCGT